MRGRYEGKTVAVTGAGEGMGRAMALAFAREGAAVMACDVNAGGLRRLRRSSGPPRAASRP